MQKISTEPVDDGVIRNFTVKYAIIYANEHYDKLKVALRKQFPGTSTGLVDHVVALAAAFDTASAFGLSFGIMHEVPDCPKGS